MTKKLIVFGCGGHSRSVIDVLIAMKDNAEIIFVDENAMDGEKIYGFSVVKNYDISDEDVFFALGDNLHRKMIYDTIGRNNLISIISDKSHVGIYSEIGKGTFIGNYCHIGPHVKIGDNTIINNGAVVDHEVIIGNHCHIGPNSTVSGRSCIEDLVFLGVGATVVDKVRICSNVVIGAGATVTKHITEPGTYVGAPAKRIK